MIPWRFSCRFAVFDCRSAGIAARALSRGGGRHVDLTARA
jgi:hypothetical protein